MSKKKSDDPDNEASRSVLDEIWQRAERGGLSPDSNEDHPIPDVDVILAYLAGEATESQTHEVRDALSRSAAFRLQLREMARLYEAEAEPDDAQDTRRVAAARRRLRPKARKLAESAQAENGFFSRGLVTMLQDLFLNPALAYGLLLTVVAFTAYDRLSGDRPPGMTVAHSVTASPGGATRSGSPVVSIRLPPGVDRLVIDVRLPEDYPETDEFALSLTDADSRTFALGRASKAGVGGDYFVPVVIGKRHLAPDTSLSLVLEPVSAGSGPPSHVHVRLLSP